MNFLAVGTQPAGHRGRSRPIRAGVRRVNETRTALIRITADRPGDEGQVAGIPGSLSVGNAWSAGTPAQKGSLSNWVSW